MSEEQLENALLRLVALAIDGKEAPLDYAERFKDGWEVVARLSGGLACAWVLWTAGDLLLRVEDLPGFERETLEVNLAGDGARSAKRSPLAAALVRIVDAKVTEYFSGLQGERVRRLQEAFAPFVGKDIPS